MFMRTKKHEEFAERSRRLLFEAQEIMDEKNKRLDESYVFGRRLCDELHKYTGTHDWHEKLDKLVGGK